MRAECFCLLCELEMLGGESAAFSVNYKWTLDSYRRSCGTGTGSLLVICICVLCIGGDVGVPGAVRGYILSVTRFSYCPYLICESL